MKFRSTAVLLAIFLVLFGYVYFVEMKKQPAETPVDKSTWVLTLAADDVRKLQVSWQGASMTVVRGDGGTWFQGEVGGAELDGTKIGTIVTSLVDLRSSRVLTQTTEGLAAFGLDQPSLTVTLGLEGNREEVLLVGNKTPAASTYYLQRKGQSAIHLVYAYLVEDLQKLVSDPPYKPTPTPEAAATPEAPAQTTPTP